MIDIEGVSNATPGSTAPTGTPLVEALAPPVCLRVADISMSGPVAGWSTRIRPSTAASKLVGIHGGSARGGAAPHPGTAGTGGPVTANVPRVTAGTIAAADIIAIHLAGPLGCCWQPAGCGALSWAYRVLPQARDLPIDRRSARRQQ